MSKLNYSKWDQLELSDDSDVEVHPNVDKKSFIKWKQRDIHEKREERKRKIAFLHSEIMLNNTLLPRVDEVIKNVAAEGVDYYQRRVAELAAIKDSPDGERPPGSTPDQPSYDNMMHALMTTVADEVKKKGLSMTDKNELGKALEANLRSHRQQLADRTEQCKKDIAHEEAESKKHITSEDIRDGWSSGHVTKNAASAQIVDPVNKHSASSQTTAKKVKGKAKEIEVLNPKSTGSQADAVPAKSGYESDKEGAEELESGDSDQEEDVPTLTPAAKKFTEIQPGNWELAFRAISSEPSLLREEVDDAILIQAFEAAIKGDKKQARQCVHAAKILSYCRNLGKDGVALFFKRMSTNKDALKVFENDVQTTWARIESRSKEMAAERAASGVNEAGEREQIQLVAQDESTTITFEVPDGPPPEEITIEGEGSDQMDPEKVRDFLQRRWDIYQSFPRNLRKALAAKDLEEVNRVLGRMSVDEGEETVQKLDEAGILSFSSTDIVDKTQEQRSS